MSKYRIGLRKGFGANFWKLQERRFFIWITRADFSCVYSEGEALERAKQALELLKGVKYE